MRGRNPAGSGGSGAATIIVVAECRTRRASGRADPAGRRSGIEPLKRLPSWQPRNAARGGRTADPLFTKQSFDSLRSLRMVSEAEGRVEPLLCLRSGRHQGGRGVPRAMGARLSYTGVTVF